MAKYWVGISGKIDMSDPDFGDVVRGKGSTSNEHTLKISYGDGYATTIKGDFDLNGKGFAVGGTITRISFEDDDHYGTTMSGLRLDLDAFVKAAKSSTPADDAKLFASIFAKNDLMDGGSQDDQINGFGGDDSIEGGWGPDRMTGGLGADVFLYSTSLDSRESSSDTITDFSQSEGDRISLRGLGFFDFDTEIRITHTNSQTIVEVDVNGGFSYPLFIRLDGNIDLTEDDFLL